MFRHSSTRLTLAHTAGRNDFNVMPRRLYARHTLPRIGRHHGIAWSCCQDLHNHAQNPRHKKLEITKGWRSRLNHGPVLYTRVVHGPRTLTLATRKKHGMDGRCKCYGSRGYWIACRFLVAALTSHWLQLRYPKGGTCQKLASTWLGPLFFPPLSDPVVKLETPRWVCSPLLRARSRTASPTSLSVLFRQCHRYPTF